MKVDSSGGAITSTTPGSAGADGEDADKDGGAEPTTAPSKRDRAEKSGSDSSPASTQKKPKRTAASTPSDSEISKSELTSDSNPSVQPRSEPVSAPVGNEVSVVDVAPQPATLTVSTAQDVPQVESAPESEVTPLLSTVLSAVGLAPSADGDIPEVPGDSPLLLAGLAALRRQTQQALTGDEALAKTVAEPSQSSLMLASADPTGGESMLLAAAVANSAPSVAPVAGSPDQATGAVVVSLHASDVDGNPLSYAVTGQPTGGSVEALGNGEFRYTPTVASRLAAAATSTPDFDSFTVTVSDGRRRDARDSQRAEVACGVGQSAVVAEHHRCQPVRSGGGRRFGVCGQSGHQHRYGDQHQNRCGGGQSDLRGDGADGCAGQCRRISSVCGQPDQWDCVGDPHFGQHGDRFGAGRDTTGADGPQQRRYEVVCHQLWFEQRVGGRCQRPVAVVDHQCRGRCEPAWYRICDRQWAAAGLCDQVRQFFVAVINATTNNQLRSSRRHRTPSIRSRWRRSAVDHDQSGRDARIRDQLRFEQCVVNKPRDQYR